VAAGSDEDQVQTEGRWLLLAREEIGRRMGADPPEDSASLERELEMQTRLKTRYPHIPLGLAIEFSRRLQTGDFTWEAWDDAVAWLETTEWFAENDGSPSG
jgi:hypothetical protein